jgi:hypothetical protein
MRDGENSARGDHQHSAHNEHAPPADPVGSRRKIKRNYSVSDEGEREQYACLGRAQPEVREIEHQHHRQRAIRKQAYEASNEQN